MRAFALSLVVAVSSLLGCAAKTEPCPCKTPAAPVTNACAVGTPVASERASAGPTASLESGNSTDAADPTPLEASQGALDPKTIELIRDALQADQAGDLDRCIEREREVLKLEDSPRVRLHLASCEQRKGKLRDALQNTERALERGIATRDASVMKVARTRVRDTLERMPHVTFVDQESAKGKRVVFDGRDVPADAHAKKFSVDPGPHVVEVTTIAANGQAAISRCELTVAERTFTPITIR